MDQVSSKPPVDETPEDSIMTDVSDTTEDHEDLKAAEDIEAKSPAMDNEGHDWEDTLISAAEGRSALADEPTDVDDSDTDPEPPATPHQENDDQPHSPVQGQPDEQVAEETSKAKKPASNRSVSVKYTPTEKYWLNRMYRSYRDQQAAQKAAKEKKETYKPAGRLLTHANLMDSFNNRFEGKYVDGCVKPRPARQQHSFGLWSTKNMRGGSEHMKGNVPDYWAIDERGTKPPNISLDEGTDDIWDDDQYLGITTCSSVIAVSKPQKRKAAVETEAKKERVRKKQKVQDEDIDDAGQFAAFDRLYAEHWPYRMRRYSAPTSHSPCQFDFLRQTGGDFNYSWAQEQADLKKR